MSWWKDVGIRLSLRFSDFISFIKGIANFDQVILRDVQPMTWDRVLIASHRTAAGTDPDQSKGTLSPSQRRRAETTRLSR